MGSLEEMQMIKNPKNHGTGLEMEVWNLLLAAQKHATKIYHNDVSN